MTTDDEPWCDASIHAGEIGVQEVDLLVGSAEWTSVETCTAARTIRGVGEVGLGVDLPTMLAVLQRKCPQKQGNCVEEAYHHNMRHAVLEREPEWRVGQCLRTAGTRRCGAVLRA